MVRRTKSAAIALRRMRAALETVEPSVKKTSVRRLAFLADMAKHARRDDVRDKVRWTGPVPWRGVKSWEADALVWLRVDA